MKLKELLRHRYFSYSPNYAHFSQYFYSWLWYIISLIKAFSSFSALCIFWFLTALYHPLPPFYHSSFLPFFLSILLSILLSFFVPSFHPSFLPSFLPSFHPSFLLTFLPSFLPTFLLTFLSTFPPIFIFFLPSFLTTLSPYCLYSYIWYLFLYVGILVLGSGSAVSHQRHSRHWHRGSFR